MSTAVLVVAVAVITIGSRVVATAVLPPPDGAIAEIVRRLPAPLFAAMAALSLVDSNHRGAPALVAAAAAVAAAVATAGRRSLLVVVVAGLVGYTFAKAVM
jgi:hypothetical protein